MYLRYLIQLILSPRLAHFDLIARSLLWRPKCITCAFTENSRRVYLLLNSIVHLEYYLITLIGMKAKYICTRVESGLAGSYRMLNSIVHILVCVLSLIGMSAVVFAGIILNQIAMYSVTTSCL